MVEIALQCIELQFPEAPVVGKPGGGVAQRLGAQPHAMRTAQYFAVDEAGMLEHAQVLGDRRQRHAEGCRQFGDASLAVHESAEDGAARAVGEGREHRIETV